MIAEGVGSASKLRHAVLARAKNQLFSHIDYLYKLHVRCIDSATVSEPLYLTAEAP